MRPARSSCWELAALPGARFTTCQTSLGQMLERTTPDGPILSSSRDGKQLEGTRDLAEQTTIMNQMLHTFHNRSPC